MKTYEDNVSLSPKYLIKLEELLVCTTSCEFTWLSKFGNMVQKMCYFDSLEKLIKRTEGENLHSKHLLLYKNYSFRINHSVVFDYRAYNQFRFLNVIALIYFFKEKRRNPERRISFFTN